MAFVCFLDDNAAIILAAGISLTAVAIVLVRRKSKSAATNAVFLANSCDERLTNIVWGVIAAIAAVITTGVLDILGAPNIIVVWPRAICSN